MVIAKKTNNFPRFQSGSNIFQGGGVQPFPGEGFKMLFSIETHITCDFSGGPDPLSPLGSAIIKDFLHQRIIL